MPNQRTSRVRPRPQRREAAENRERVLAAARAAIKRDGLTVPLTTIAREAGVGTATIYRQFPDRESLIAALSEQSHSLILALAQAAEATDGLAIDAVRHYLLAKLAANEDLLLPMMGGPVAFNANTKKMRKNYFETFNRILRRGQEDGSIRADVTSLDIVIFGNHLAQPRRFVPDWPAVATRQAEIFLAGLATTDAPHLTRRAPTPAQLVQEFDNARDR